MNMTNSPTVFDSNPEICTRKMTLYVVGQETSLYIWGGTCKTLGTV